MEAKVITLFKPGKDPKFFQNLRAISLLSKTGNIFDPVIFKFLQKHIDERGRSTQTSLVSVHVTA
jgi:hypothetical protein